MRFTTLRGSSSPAALVLLAAVILAVLVAPPLTQKSQGAQANNQVVGNITRWAPVSALSEPMSAVVARERRFGAAYFQSKRREIPEPKRPNLRDRVLPGAFQQEDLGTLFAPPLSRPGNRALSGVRPRTPDPTIEFDTLPNTGFTPPDDAIAAGPNHLVCSGNASLQVRTFAGQLLSSVTLAAFFPADPTGFIFDPRVSYDAAAQRFILCAVGVDDPSRTSTIVLAVSANSDPTGTWNKYVFNIGRGGPPAVEWADFPQLGFDGSAIYVSCNMFTFQGFAFGGNRTLILNKATAGAGGALNGIVVDNLTLPPPVGQGVEAPGLTPAQGVAAGQPGMILTDCIGIGLAYYRVTDPLGQSGGPTFASSFIDTTDFQIAGTAPQSGTAVKLDVGDERLHHVVYRGGVLWTCHTVSSAGAFGKAQVRFYLVGAAGAGSLTSTLTIGDANFHYFYPSFVPDTSGNAIAVFQGSSTSTHPAIFHVRYDAGQGNFEAPLLTEESASTYTQDRYGDYTDASLDVASGNSVWIQGELAVTSTTWKMRAAKIRSTTVPGSSGIWGRVTAGANGLQGVTMTLTPGGATSQTDLSGNYVLQNVADGSYTVTPTLAGFTFNPTSRNVNIAGSDVWNQDFAAVEPAKTVTGRVTKGGTGIANVLLTLTPGNLTANTNSNGDFTINNVTSGNKTLTPTLAGHTFTPVNRQFTVGFSGNVPGQDFTAAAALFSISGTITGGRGSLAGINVKATGAQAGATQTASNGTYTISNLKPGNYTITPKKGTRKFTPKSRPVTLTNANVAGVNFTRKN